MDKPENGPTPTDNNVKTEIKSYKFPIEFQCALVSSITAVFLAFTAMILFFKIGNESKCFWSAELGVSALLAILAGLFSIPLGFIVAQFKKPIWATLTGFVYFIVFLGPFTPIIYCIIFNSLNSILGYHHPLLWDLFNNPFSNDPFPEQGPYSSTISPVIELHHYLYPLGIFGAMGAIVGGILAIYKRDRLNPERKMILPRFHIFEMFIGFFLLAVTYYCLIMLVRHHA